MSAQPAPRPGSNCPHRTMVHIATADGRECAVWKGCESWACRVCAKWLTKNWTAAMTETINRAQDNGVQLYLWSGLRSVWESRVRRAIHRAGGNAYRVHVGKITTVITDAPIQGFGEVAVTENRIASMLERIENKHGRPVAALGAWPTAKHRQKAKSEWKIIGKGKRQPEQIRRALREFELEYSEKFTDRTALFSWTIPGHWSAEHLSNFRARLKGVRSKPSAPFVANTGLEWTIDGSVEWNLENWAEEECAFIEQDLKRRAAS